MVKGLITLVIAVVAVFGLVQIFDGFNTLDVPVAVDSFTECVEAGFPVMESYPRQCKDEAGNNFVEDIDTSGDMQNMIRVTEPTVDTVVEGTVTVLGEARGTWFFEATAPVEVQTREGVVLARGYVEALGEWMTEEFVPFRGMVDLSGFDEEAVVLVVKRADPRGEDEEKTVEIPLRLKDNPVVGTPCFVTGCSGQICSDEEVFSTCEWKQEYACYKQAVCERQAPNGECGWTETEKFSQCLANPPVFPELVP